MAYTFESFRLIEMCAPVVGGSLGELMKQVMPSTEMNLLIEHYKDLSKKIDVLSIKIDSEVNKPQNLLLIHKTIKDSTEDEIGGKWKFYRNVLLHGFSGSIQM